MGVVKVLKKGLGFVLTTKEDLEENRLQLQLVTNRILNAAKRVQVGRNEMNTEEWEEYAHGESEQNSSSTQKETYVFHESIPHKIYAKSYFISQPSKDRVLNDITIKMEEN